MLKWSQLNLLIDKQTSGKSMYSKAIKNQSVTMHPLSYIFLGVFMIPKSWSEECEDSMRR